MLKLWGARVRLYFLFGERIINQLRTCFARDLQLNALLSTRPEDFVAKVDLLKQQSREANQQLTKLSAELAQLCVEKAITALSTEPVAGIFKSGVGPEFIKVATTSLRPWVAKVEQADAEPKTIILTAGLNHETSGPVVVFGRPKLIPKVVRAIMKFGSLKKIWPEAPNGKAKLPISLRSLRVCPPSWLSLNKPIDV